jgi:MFS family permease
MVLGALVVPKLAERLSLQALFVGGVAGFGFSMLGFASFGIYWVASLFAVGAGFCLAAVTVAGNTYVQETVCVQLRGRVFTALESVIRVALLLSLVVTAPLGDLIGGIVRDVVEARGILPDDVVLTGSRITLTIASFIVLGAAYYGFRTLEWKTPGPAAANGPRDSAGMPRDARRPEEAGAPADVSMADASEEAE